MDSFCFPKNTKNPNPSPIGKKFGFYCGAPRALISELFSAFTASPKATVSVPSFNYEDAKKQTLAKIGRIYDEILNRFQAASAVLHHNYTNFGTFSRKGALQSGVV